jgi:hypothetical protein
VAKESVSKLLDEAMRQVGQVGQRAEAALMSPATANKLTAEFGHVRTSGGTQRSWESDEDFKQRQSHERGEGGGFVITQLHTAFGAINILTSPHCPPDIVYVGDIARLYEMMRYPRD